MKRREFIAFLAAQRFRGLSGGTRNRLRMSLALWVPVLTLPTAIICGRFKKHSRKWRILSIVMLRSHIVGRMGKLVGYLALLPIWSTCK